MSRVIAIKTSNQKRDGTARPNALPFSSAAAIERERFLADSIFQKSPDLARREAASTASAGWAADTGRFGFVVA
jgi:hypothetical protein